jgi:hypothetical protein
MERFLLKDISAYTRVTDVLYPFSGLDQIDPDILKRAADRGTFIHKVCESIIQCMPYPEVPSSWVGYIDSFKIWYEGKNFLNNPGRFFCDDLMLTGECDGIYINNDKERVLFDLKTPLKESKTWALQGSAYHYLANKNSCQVDKIEFVKLSKDGKAPKIYQYEPNFELYRKCLDVFRYFSLGKDSETLEFI